jgi:hypothetical protein
MKEQFRQDKISSQKAEMISLINSILEDYAAQGYRLTLRQLYYQLVARDFIPNTVKEYAKLSDVCVTGRMNGLIDWDYIEDRIRRPFLQYSSDSIQDALEDTIHQYKLNRQEGQPYNIEVWTEKDAVSNILKRGTNFYHIKLMVNRGYSSCSAMFEASKRITGDNIILYVGDHDPSGLDMLRDIEDRLKEFEVDEFEVIPVALTMEQIKKYNPPPNPAKITDPRAKRYILEHGEHSWELDALKPDVLYKILDDAILKYLDLTKFKKMLDQEKRDKKKLSQIIKNL